MNLKGCFKVWNKYGMKRYIKALYEYFLINHWTSRIDYLVSKRKGKCNNCGKCCVYTGTGKKCEYLTKDNKCSVYNKRHLVGKKECMYAPLPSSLKTPRKKKWKDCGYYYEKK